MVTQKLAVYFLKLILYAIWHYRKMRHFEKVASTAETAISLVVFSFKYYFDVSFKPLTQSVFLDSRTHPWGLIISIKSKRSSFNSGVFSRVKT